MDAQLLIVPWLKKTCQTNFNSCATARAWRVKLSSGFRQNNIQGSLLKYYLEN